MAYKHLIEIETIKAGQPRPYADSVYEFVFTFSGGVTGKYTPMKDKVLELALYWFNHKNVALDKEKREWFQPYLDKIEKLDENKWSVKFIDPYLD